jgi:hypothetical protein
MVDAGSGLMDSCGGMTEEQNVADQLTNGSYSCIPSFLHFIPADFLQHTEPFLVEY